MFGACGRETWRSTSIGLGLWLAVVRNCDHSSWLKKRRTDPECKRSRQRLFYDMCMLQTKQNWCRKVNVYVRQFPVRNSSLSASRHCFYLADIWSPMKKVPVAWKTICELLWRISPFFVRSQQKAGSSGRLDISGNVVIIHSVRMLRWRPKIGQISSTTVSRSTTKQKSSASRRDLRLFMWTLATDGTYPWPTDTILWTFDVSTFLTELRVSMCILPAMASVFVDEWVQLLELILTIPERHPELTEWIMQTYQLGDQRLVSVDRLTDCMRMTALA